jgi:AcrR family transcriptional regulator
VENTRINEITDEADLGFGSFYNHESKAAILEEVLMETGAARGGTVDAATAQLDDPAEVIAAAHRHLVRLARRDPEWGWLVVRGNLGHDVVLAALGPFAERDIRRGVQRGRLFVCDERGGALWRRGRAAGRHAIPSSTARRPRTPTSTTPRARSASSASP